MLFIDDSFEFIYIIHAPLLVGFNSNKTYIEPKND